MKKTLSVLVLAAGRGTRMKSRTAKVLHPVLGRPLLAWSLDVARALPAERRGVVVGHQAEAVAQTLSPEFTVVRQGELLGTGHAVRQARALFSGEGDLVVLSGDTPLLRAATVKKILAEHRRRKATVTLLTAQVADPTGYGRIVRCGGGNVKAIVEHDDAPAEVRGIREINAGVYCFENRFLAAALLRLRAANRQEEYYLTDVIAHAVRERKTVVGVPCTDPEEIQGVNDRVQLAAAEAILRHRKLEELMRGGVTVRDPASTWVEQGVRIGADTVLLPRTHLEGKTVVGAGCHIGPGVRVRDSRIGAAAVVKDSCVIEGAVLGSHCHVGPFAHLRPGSVLETGARVGNFVETKKTWLGAGSKANHLSYLGDARIGKAVNIGAGTITCNYDGWHKWETVIGDGVFIGSDTQLVAPVTVGKGALIAAGSTITHDVPPGALALSRAPQENREGYAERRRKRMERARARDREPG